MTNDQRAPIRIVGGGMTGLTLGYRLAKQGYSVCVHERDPYLGGLSSEAALADVPVERYYHCVLPTDTTLLSLLNELGLESSISWTKTRTGFFHGGRLLEMTTTRDFLRFPAINLTDRLRLGWTIAYCGLLPDWKKLDREPVGPFLKRHGGKRLFESIWEPLLLAKLGPEYDRFAASFIWATVYRMLSARKAKGRSEKLGFVQGRYGKVFNALRQAIENQGSMVMAGSPVEGISPGRGQPSHRWTLHVGGQDLPARGIILCIPAPVAAPLLREAHIPVPEELTATEYLGVICDVMLLRRSLTPYYVLNLTDRRLPLTGVIEFSNLTGPAEFSGRGVVYIPRYRDGASPDWARSDQDIHAESVDGLRTIIPDLEASDILAWQVNRARYVQPVHPLNWGSSLPPVRLASGLAYLSTAQIHPWPVFNDEVVRHVDAKLPEVLGVMA